MTQGRSGAAEGASVDLVVTVLLEGRPAARLFSGATGSEGRGRCEAADGLAFDRDASCLGLALARPGLSALRKVRAKPFGGV